MTSVPIVPLAPARLSMMICCPELPAELGHDDARGDVGPAARARSEGRSGSGDRGTPRAACARHTEHRQASTATRSEHDACLP